MPDKPFEFFPQPAKPSPAVGLDADTEARVQKYSQLNGVDPDLTRRMVHQESGGKSNAHSWAGAGGTMQLMPDTARSLGVTDVNDPDQNINAGTKYLRQQLDTFNGDVPSAVGAYNAGPGAIEKHGLDRVRKFSNFPKGDPRRGGYAGSTGEYIDKITSGYTGSGYHPDLQKPAPAKPFEFFPQPGTASNTSNTGNTDNTDNTDVRASAPPAEPSLFQGQPETAETGVAGQTPTPSTVVRVPVKEGAQSTDVLRDGLILKGQQRGLDDKAAKAFANEALAQIAGAGGHPGLHGPDGQTPLDDAGMADLYKHGYADLNIDDPAYDKLIDNHLLEARAVQADKQLKVNAKTQSENAVIKTAIGDGLDKDGKAAAQKALADNLRWHFGVNDMAEFNRMPVSKQRQMIVLATEAAAGDQKKKDAGETITPSLEYQNLMRAKVHLGPNPAMIDPRMPMPRAQGGFSFNQKTAQELLGIHEPGKITMPRPAFDFAKPAPVAAAEPAPAPLGSIRPLTFGEGVKQSIQNFINDYVPGLATLNSEEGPKTNALAGAVDALTLGAVKIPEYHTFTTPQKSQLAQTEPFDEQGAKITGELIGSLVPYIGMAKLVKVASEAPKIAAFLNAMREAGPVGRAAVRAAQSGATFGSIGVAKEGVKTARGEGAGFKEAAKSVAKDTLLGGTIGILAGDDPNLVRHIASFAVPSAGLAAATGESQSPVKITGDAVTDSIIFNSILGLATHEGEVVGPLKAAAREAGAKVIASDIAPEPVREFVGKTFGLKPTVVLNESGTRAASVYVKPGTNEQIRREVTPEEGQAFLDKDRPNMTVKDDVFDNVMGSKQMGPEPAGVAPINRQLSENGQKPVQDLTQPKPPAPNTSPEAGQETKPETVQFTVKGQQGEKREGSGTVVPMVAEDLDYLKSQNLEPDKFTLVQNEHGDLEYVDNRAINKEPASLAVKNIADLKQGGSNADTKRSPAPVVKEESPGLAAGVGSSDAAGETAGAPAPKGGPAQPKKTEATVLPEAPSEEVIKPADVEKDVEKHKELHKPETAYEFSSTQVNLPADIAARVKKIASAIPDKDLAGDGRETNPHTTVKFGLHTNDVEDVKRVLADEGPIKVKIGKMSTFPPSDSSDGAEVLKLDVDSPDLHRLNKKLSDALPHTDTFDYKPHITVGYVKPGVAKKYVGKKHPLQGKEISIDSIAFSSKDGKLIEIPLTKNVDSNLPPKSYDSESHIPGTSTEKSARPDVAAADAWQSILDEVKLHVSNTRNDDPLAVAQALEMDLPSVKQALEELYGKKAGKETETKTRPDDTNGPAREEKVDAERSDRIELPDARSVALPEALAKIESQTVKTERGTSAQMKPAVVDAKDLITSLDEGYPQQFQPRDRSRAASKEQISRIANNLDSDFLGDSPKASEGRPLVVPVHVGDKLKYAVISGNGRVAGIKEAYHVNKADKYREFAISKGESKSKQPVYVGVLHGDQDWTKFAREANESGVARMSAVEQAQDDAKVITPELMAKFYPSDDGDVNTAANRDFIRDMVNQVAGTDQRGQLLTDDGRLSVDGVNRVRNAIFAKAYGGSKEGLNALAKMAEDPDNNIRQITNALLRHAGGFAELKENIAAGTRHDLDISEDLVKAAAKLSALREDEMSVENYLKQGSMFGDDLDTLQRRILVVLNENKRSTRAISDILDNYLRGANMAGNPSNMGMWDAVNLTPSIEPLWDAAIKETKEVSDEAKRLLGLAGESTLKPRVRKNGGSVSKTDQKHPAVPGSNGRTPKPASSGKIVGSADESAASGTGQPGQSKNEPRRITEEEKATQLQNKQEQLAKLKTKGLAVGDAVEMEVPIAGGLGGSELMHGTVKRAKSGAIFVQTEKGGDYSAFDNPWTKSEAAVDDWHEVKQDLGDDHSVSAIEKLYGEHQELLDKILVGDADPKEQTEFQTLAKAAGVSMPDIAAILQEGQGSQPLFKLNREAALDRLKESDDAEIKSLANLVDRKGLMMGQGDAGQAAVDNLIRALDKYARLRETKTTVADYLRQDALFEGTQLTSMQEGMLRAFEQHSGKTREISRLVAEYLGDVQRGSKEFKGEVAAPAAQGALFKTDADRRIIASHSTDGQLADKLAAEAHGHRLKLNPSAYELIRRAYEATSKRNERPSFTGLFADARLVKKIVAQLRQVARKNPDRLQNIADLAGAIKNAAGDNGTVVFYTKEGVLIHEGFHYSSDAAASDQSLIARHGNFDSLLESDAFEKAVDLLIDKGYPATSPGNLVDELAARVWDGDYEDLDLTDAEAEDYLDRWFKSYLSKNPDASREEFEHEREENRQLINAARGNERRQDVRRIQGEGSGRHPGPPAGAEAGPGEEALFTRDDEEELDPRQRLFRALYKARNKDYTPRNVTSGRIDLERDSQVRHEDADWPTVSTQPGATEPSAPARSGEAGVAGRGAGRGPGVSDGGAVTGRKRSDRPVPGTSPVEAGVIAGDKHGAGSGPDLDARAPFDSNAASPTERAAEKSQQLRAKRAAQRAADNVPVKAGDRDNIAETLPFLYPHQHDNILKAEERFAKADGFAHLFTDGTGTGKTYTGLGLVYRYARRGKDNILITAPNDKIIEDWIRSAENLNLPIRRLESTKDNGRKGIVITTYANFGQNAELVKRKWDLIVSDEAHNLGTNQSGEPTLASDQLRAITMHPDGAWFRQEMVLNEQYKELADLKARIKAYEKSIDERGHLTKLNDAKDRYEELVEEIERLGKPIRDEVAATKPKDRTRAVMLSATPFSYQKSVKFAQNFLFDWNKGFTQRSGYNQPTAEQNFFITHLGWRMRTGKLTQPDVDVNSDVMEQELHEWLKNQEKSLSSYKLQIDADYERNFVLVDDAIGRKIDEGLEWLSRAEDGRYRPLYDLVSKNFGYLQKMFLLESLKAKNFVPIIKQHLALGRKVLVVHDYNKGGGFHPFQFDRNTAGDVSYSVKGQAQAVQVAELVDEFEKKRPDLVDMDFSRLKTAIETMQEAFGDDAMFFNGRVPAKQRSQSLALFNADDSGKNLLVAQSDAAKEGINAHDTTGHHQRVTVNLGMPVRPTKSIQLEGRTRRDGAVSDAIYNYGTTGTNFETWTFAHTISERTGTAENLGMGAQARALREAFVDAYENAVSGYEPAEGEGKGGKEADARRDAEITPYERAKSYYFGQRKRTSRDKSLEGVDYFATPEPIGLKMVDWSDLQPGEYIGEPSAGHGAIARFFPPDSHRTMIEPSMELAARLGLIADGRIVNSNFEDLHVTNKFDALVMNPPFGSGGSTAIKHLAKAVAHLRDGGRIVALIPEGPAADKKLDKFYESPESANLFRVADIKLPGVVFERAGTSVRTHIVVLEKQKDGKRASQIEETNLDFSQIDNIKDLFDALEHVELPKRIPVPEAQKEAPIADQANADLPDVATGPAPKETERFVMGEFKHTQTGAEVYAATPKGHLGDDWKGVLARAKQNGGYYSKYKQGGAIAGFLFANDSQRANFLNGMGEKEIAGDDGAGLGELSAPTRLPSNALVRTQQRIEVAPLAGGEPKAPQQIIVDFDKALGHRTVIGKMNRGQAGSYNPTSGKTAIRYSGDLDTAAHEISHQLDDRFGIVKDWAGARQHSPFDGELIPRFSQFGVTSKKASLQEQRAEAVAEWVRALIANPGAAKGAAPLFYEHFMKMVPGSVRKSLGDFSIKVREFAGLPATQRTSANIEQLADKRPSTRSMTLLGDLNKSVNDSLAPLMKGIVMAKEMRGIDDIGAAHDPETLVRLVAGYNDKYLDMIKNGLRDAEGKPVTKGGVKWLLEPLATHKETLPDGNVVSRDATRAELNADMRDTMVLIVSERVLEKAGQIQDLADERISGLDKDKPTYEAVKKRIQDTANLRKARLAGTGGGIYADDKQAEEALYELFGDTDRLARLKEAADRYRQWMDAALEYWVAKGRLSRESKDRIREKNEYYGSFQRLAETIDAQYVPSFLGRSSKKLASSYKGIYAFKGSTRRIQHLYLSLLDQTYRFYKEADRNFAVRAFTELLTTDRKMHDGEVQDLARIGYETKQGDRNSVTVWADGKRKVWKFAPDVFNALKGWGEVDDPNIIYKILQIPATIARSTIVRSPYFLARHLVRYSLHRSVVSEVGGKPWDILTGYSKDDLSMYRNMGGGMGGFDATGRDAYRKTMKLAITELAKDKNTILTVPGKLWRGYNSLVHQADMRVRMAEYRRAYAVARRQGHTELDAATYAAAQSRALLDWAIAGTAARKISKYVPFVVPRIQGIATSARAFRRSPGAFLARWALYVLLPTLLTYLWNRAHGADTLHEYQEKSSYERDFFWNFKITSNRWLRVAKPYELGVMASGAERLLDYALGNKHALEGWPADFVKALTPLDESNAIAGPFHAGAEIATNYDFFRGRNIVPPDEAEKDLDLRKGTVHASRVGQLLQRALGVDARYIDHTIAGSTGDLGRMALDASDIGRGDQKHSLAGLFTAESPAYGAPDVQFVYDRARGRGEMNSLPMRMLHEQLEAWRDARTDSERDAKAKIVRESAAELRKHFEGREASVLGAYLPKPLPASETKAVDQEMFRLDYTPKFVGENLKIDGEEVKVEPAQFRDYSQRVGAGLYDGFNRIIQQKDYSSLSDEQKVKALDLWSSKIRDLEQLRLKNNLRPGLEDVQRALEKAETRGEDRGDQIDQIIDKSQSGKFKLKPRPKKVAP